MARDRGDRIIRGEHNGDLARNPRLSHTARGLLAEILSHADDADAGAFTVAALTAAARTAGGDRRGAGYRRAVRELEATGYRHRIITRDGGIIATRYDHYEVPVRPCGEDCSTCNGYAGRGARPDYGRRNGYPVPPAETSTATPAREHKPRSHRLADKQRVGDPPENPADPTGTATRPDLGKRARPPQTPRSHRLADNRPSVIGEPSNRNPPEPEPVPRTEQDPPASARKIITEDEGAPGPAVPGTAAQVPDGPSNPTSQADHGLNVQVVRVCAWAECGEPFEPDPSKGNQRYCCPAHHKAADLARRRAKARSRGGRR